MYDNLFVLFVNNQLSCCIYTWKNSKLAYKYSMNLVSLVCVTLMNNCIFSIKSMESKSTFLSHLLGTFIIIIIIKNLFVTLK